MAKKDNEEIPFSASPGAGNSEKLQWMPHNKFYKPMDKIENFSR